MCRVRDFYINLIASCDCSLSCHALIYVPAVLKRDKPKVKVSDEEVYARLSAFCIALLIVGAVT